MHPAVLVPGEPLVWVATFHAIMMRVLQFLSVAGLATAACNGHNELCNRKYSDVVQIGAHDSAFVGRGLADNQRIAIGKQLDRGVRFLQAQTHKKDGDVELCHTFCFEKDAGPLKNYLGDVAKWMKDNQNEVVTMLLTNQDKIPMEKFDEAFKSSGLKDFVFRPRGGKVAKDQWPTLQQLIDAKTRLIVFMDFNSDLSKADYILPEFDHFWETPFGVTDSNFPNCDVDRPAGGDPAKLMGLMNHMLNFEIGSIVIPNQPAARRTNSFVSIKKQVDLCVSKQKFKPNVVLLDWVDQGDIAKAAKVLNSL